MKLKSLLKCWPFGVDALMGFLWCCSLTPYNVVPLFWVGLFYFFERLDRAKTVTSAAGIGWAFGIGFCWSAYYWLVLTLENFGQVPLPIAALLIVIYNCFFATEYLLLAMFLQPTFHRLRDRPWLKLFWASVLFIFVDAFFPQHFPHTGALVFAPFPFWLQTSDLWGDLGVTWILYLSVIGLWLVGQYWQRQKARSLQFALPTLVGFLVLSIYGVSAGKKWQHVSSDQTALLAGIQANIGNVDKIESSREEGQSKKLEVLKRYLHQTQAIGVNQVDLIVWPETAFPGYISFNQYTPFLIEAAAQLQTDLLIGAMDGLKDSHDTRYVNGMFLINHQEKRIEQSYYKHVLLAFGEYVPLSGTFPWLQKVIPAIGQYTPGPGPKTLAWRDRNGKPHQLGVSICYEAIIPRFVNALALQNPDLFVNITNDSWYGNTREPSFHFLLQAMRAIEYRRYLFRLANTGYSAVVSPYGSILKMTKLDAKETLIAHVPFLSGHPTFYAQFGFWGLRIAILILTALAFIIGPKLGFRQKQTS